MMTSPSEGFRWWCHFQMGFRWWCHRQNGFSWWHHLQKGFRWWHHLQKGLDDDVTFRWAYDDVVTFRRTLDDDITFRRALEDLSSKMFVELLILEYWIKLIVLKIFEYCKNNKDDRFWILLLYDAIKQFKNLQIILMLLAS